MYLLLACHSLHMFLAWLQLLGCFSCIQSQQGLWVMLAEGRQSVSKELERNPSLSLYKLFYIIYLEYSVREVACLMFVIFCYLV